MCRNTDVLAGVVYFIHRHKFPFSNSVLTTPAGKRTIVNASKLAIPSTPPLKGGEIYITIFQVVKVVLITFASLRLTAIPCAFVPLSPCAFAPISN